MSKKLKNILLLVIIIGLITNIYATLSYASPTIDTTKTGSLTLYKYEVADLSEYTTPGTGETETVTTTTTTKPISGVKFEIYKIGGVDIIQTDSGDPSTYTPVGTATANGTSNTSGVITFTGLELGRYYVKEVSAPDNVKTKTAPFFVDIPMTNASGTDWIYDVKAYPKNQTVYGSVILTKVDVNDNTKLQGAKFDLHQTELNGVSIADTVKVSNLTTNANGQIIIDNLPFGKYYFIETSAPTNYILDNTTKYNFEITQSGTVILGTNDSIVSKDASVQEVTVPNSKTLEINKSVTVKSTVTDTASVQDDVKWITSSTVPKGIENYSKYQITTVLPNELTYKTGQTITVKIGDTALTSGTDFTFTQEGQNLDLVLNTNSNTVKNAVSSSSNELTLEYIAPMNINALSKLGQAIQNTATLKYISSLESGNIEHEVVSNNAEVHTGGYTFKKVNSSNTKLSGAKFKIAKVANPSSNSDYVSAYDSNNNLTFEFTSDSNGMVEIKGLAYGTYYLVETKAPVDASTGKTYSLLKSPQSIIIDATSHQASNNYTIINRMIPTLPFTGGAGSKGIIIIGLLLILIGTCYYKRGKKTN